jgi:hypothetical protein
MPIIFDPDLLIDGTEIIINTTTLTIELRSVTENPASNIDDEGSSGGVTGQALYSKLKELWRTNSTYIRFPFPMESITPEQFEFINGWLPSNNKTRQLIRSAGWAERNSSGNITRIYAGVISLGVLGSTDQPYYQSIADGPATNFAYQGAVNEAVQIFGDENNGNFDRRTFLKLFAREQGKTYASSSLTDIGVTNMTYIVYRFPLTNSIDLNITTSDAVISTTAPYTGITVEYFTTDQNRTIGSSSFPFRIIINGNNATNQQIYEKIQFLLRQNSDIDDGIGNVNGRTADALLRFVGSTLVTSQGTFIDNFNEDFTNSIEFFDQSNTIRTFPFVASGSLQFGANLVSDVDAIYRMFFTTLPGAGNDFGESGAVIVNDSNGNPISGNINGNSAISWTFSYDSNSQGGRTPGTDAQVTVVALGLNKAQYTQTTTTIQRRSGQNISVTAALERNYSNL